MMTVLLLPVQQHNAAHYPFSYTELPHITSKHNEGQALAELIIACAILAIVLFGVVTTINFSVNAAAVSSNKTRSIYLAQEGLERARAARDESWDSFQNSSYLSANPEPIAGTVFTRTITIAGSGNTQREVTSTVHWFDGSTRYETRLVTVLTNR